jgi:hypothetical protein
MFKHMVRSFFFFSWSYHVGGHKNKNNNHNETVVVGSPFRQSSEKPLNEAHSHIVQERDIDKQ